jgi:chromosome segregation ATPase
LQRAQQKLHDSQHLFGELKQNVSQLEPVAGQLSNDENNPVTELHALDAQLQRVSSELDDAVKRLEAKVKLLDDVRTEIDDMVASQVVVKQSLVRELPVRQDELQKELNELQVPLIGCLVHLII